MSGSKLWELFSTGFESMLLVFSMFVNDHPAGFFLHEECTDNQHIRLHFFAKFRHKGTGKQELPGQP